jgi:hypothetical protein
MANNSFSKVHHTLLLARPRSPLTLNFSGVAYQGTPDDPLINVAQCTADAALMQSMSTNSIRVYHVDPYADHSGCMSVFANAGIYIWLDLDTFNTSIYQDAPRWTEQQFFAFTEVMDAFQHFDNLAGFWIGNEVISTAAGSPAAPFVKASVTDIKAYLAAKKYRKIPIGYSAADIAELRPMLQDYLACGSDSSQTIDFFGLNSYEWCGNVSYITSGYQNLQTMASGYNIPIFFSETGCIVPKPRTFEDQTAIFGPDMLGTWSGSIVYEWVQETNGYGLVTYPDGKLTGKPTPIQPDFSNLQNQWKTLNPTGVAASAYTPSLSPPPCPSSTPGRWLINGNPPLPTLGAAAVAAVAASVKPSNRAPITTSPPQTAMSTTMSSTTDTSSASASSTGQASGASESKGASAASGSASANVRPGVNAFGAQLLGTAMLMLTLLAGAVL